MNNEIADHRSAGLRICMRLADDGIDAGFLRGKADDGRFAFADAAFNVEAFDHERMGLTVDAGNPQLDRDAFFSDDGTGIEQVGFSFLPSA